jgi:hypothetical protein
MSARVDNPGQGVEGGRFTTEDDDREHHNLERWVGLFVTFNDDREHHNPGGTH